MAIPIGTIIEITQQGDLCGQTCMSVYHYVVNIASSTPSGVDELMNLMLQHWNAGPATISEAYLSVTPENYTLRRTYAQAVFPVRARKVVLGQAHQGTTIPATTGNVQASVTLTSDLAGRRHIGGKRVPIAPGLGLDGIIPPLFKVVVDTYAAECAQPLPVAIGGGEYLPVIYHRPPAPPPHFDLITSSFAQDSVRVLRRRTVGLGI